MLREAGFHDATLLEPTGYATSRFTSAHLLRAAIARG